MIYSYIHIPIGRSICHEYTGIHINVVNTKLETIETGTPVD